MLCCAVWKENSKGNLLEKENQGTADKEGRMLLMGKKKKNSVIMEGSKRQKPFSHEMYYNFLKIFTGNLLLDLIVKE